MFSGTLYNLFSAGPVAVEEPRSLVATALNLYWYAILVLRLVFFGFFISL